MPVDPELLEILACPNCKTKVELVKNGTALKCAPVQARLSDQGRHPVMLLGRGDHRTVTRACAPHPPATHRRRGLHDAADSGAEANASPTPRLSYLVERDAAAVVAGNPASRRGDRGRALAWARPHRRRPAAGVAAARARFDVVIDMHGGPRSSWLTLATGAPQRIGYDIAGPAVDVHAHGAAAARAPAASFGGQPMGPAQRDRRLDRRAARSRADDPVEMPLDAAADRRIAGRLRAAGVDAAARADRGPRQRRAIRSGAGRSRPSPTLVAGLVAASRRRAA